MRDQNTTAPPAVLLELNAYLDGALEHDPVRKAAFEQRLVDEPELAAKLDAYRRQQAALRAHYVTAVEEAGPLCPGDAVEKSRAESSSYPVFVRVAAALALLLLGAIAGVMVERGMETPEQVVADTPAPDISVPSAASDLTLPAVQEIPVFEEPVAGSPARTYPDSTVLAPGMSAPPDPLPTAHSH